MLLAIENHRDGLPHRLSMSHPVAERGSAGAGAMIAPKARLAGLDWRDNPYGSFDQATGAFVIRDPLTPRPWVNVMANEDYGLVISQKGGGFSWYKNCQLGRLTRWDQDLAADDQGRFFFVRDTDTGETFSTTFQPVMSCVVEDDIVP